MSGGRYILIWLDANRSIDGAIVGEVRRQMEDKILHEQDETEIDVWLDSPGGDAHSAYKLALILRQVASKVRIVIPDYAKSAATLLAIAGDEIYMAPGAELGPLDAQIPEEGSLIGRISALNIARAADDVADTALTMAITGGASVIRATGQGRAETIEAMLRFSAEFSEPLMRQLDPRVVHDAKQLLNVTARYAERLLSETNCENAETIAQKMVEDYPTHGYVIDIEEARRIGLPVIPIAEYEEADNVSFMHRAVADDLDSAILFLPMDEFLADEGEEDDEDNEPEQESPVEDGDPDQPVEDAPGDEAVTSEQRV